MVRVLESLSQCKDTERVVQWAEPCVDRTEQRVQRRLGLLGGGSDDDWRCFELERNEYFLQLNHGWSAVQPWIIAQCAVGI